jgi:hypothetical protein
MLNRFWLRFVALLRTKRTDKAVNRQEGKSLTLIPMELEQDLKANPEYEKEVTAIIVEDLMKYFSGCTLDFVTHLTYELRFKISEKATVPSC